MFQGYFKWLESLHIGIEAEKSLTLLLFQLVLGIILMWFPPYFLYLNIFMVFMWLLRLKAILKSKRHWIDTLDSIQNPDKNMIRERKKLTLIGLLNELNKEEEEKRKRC